MKLRNLFIDNDPTYNNEDIARMMEAFVQAWDTGLLYDSPVNRALYNKIQSHRTLRASGKIYFGSFNVTRQE